MRRREFLQIGALGAIQEFHRGGMRYRRLGRTDLFVSALGFGSHTDYQQRVKTAGGTHLREDYQQVRTRQTARALDLGVNVVDVYDEAGQYEPLAQLARSRRDSILIATKFNEFPGHTGRHIDRAAKLFGHVDLGRYVVREETDIPPSALENWDLLRKARAAGKLRAIGIATHSPEVARKSLTELEGLEFIFLPYNFIHAQAQYGSFFTAARRAGVGLVAMKPLASGSIVKLDPRRPRPDAHAEGDTPGLALQRPQPLLQEAVARLVQNLGRRPEETLAQAALRFVFSEPAIACSLTGMFLPEELEENYRALASHAPVSTAVLESARQVAALSERRWLPPHYRWLDEQWTPHRS
ncbi:MAG: aldo/keto reductase [Bryobacterales bacterium]|nr:aldo/keto reductase [Bryobacterales bacterium]